jgi:hypothetical protein
MNRGKPLRHDPARAAERRERRERRREAEGPRPEDLAREARRVAREAPASALEVEDRAASRAWNRAAEAQGCVMCAAELDGHDRFPVSARTRRERAWDLAKIDGHHIIAKQALKRWGLFALLWDVRNMLPLCRYHHFRHEQAYQRVPRDLLPRRAREFAREINAEYMLDDDDVYPVAA